MEYTWLKKKNKDKLSKEMTKVRFFIQIILVFTLLALPLLFFTIAGDKIANWVVFITVFFILFAFIISSKNLIAMLEIEIDKIDVEILNSYQYYTNFNLKELFTDYSFHINFMKIQDMIGLLC